MLTSNYTEVIWQLLLNTYLNSSNKKKIGADLINSYDKERGSRNAPFFFRNRKNIFHFFIVYTYILLER